MDFETLKEKLLAQSKAIREISQKLKQHQDTTETAIKVANQTDFPKTNIKFLKLEENKKENMRGDLVKILKSTVDLDINSDDILAIHRIPGRDQRGPRPAHVIAKFISKYRDQSKSNSKKARRTAKETLLHV